jgi:hypothetical protein
MIRGRLAKSFGWIINGNGYETDHYTSGGSHFGGNNLGAGLGESSSRKIAAAHRMGECQKWGAHD